jgi:uncharacterized Ntn-hydrolase superfamily protein
LRGADFCAVDPDLFPADNGFCTIFRAEQIMKSIIACITLLSASALSLPLNVPPALAELHRPSTWSIVAMDPQTGEMGIAVATCVPAVDSYSASAAIVPGKGIAATQGAFDLGNRNKVFEALKQGMDAKNVIALVNAEDMGMQSRQYAVITVKDGKIDIAGFTGVDSDAWAGHRVDEANAVIAQGNILEGGEVLTNALTAFSAPDAGPLHLADRLMRALEAGAAAGGDKRCNTGGITQTSSIAYIMVARPNQQPFAETEVNQFNPAAPNAPWLYLSKSSGANRVNAVTLLRQDYDTWRAKALPACEGCKLAIDNVPGGDPSAPKIDNLQMMLNTPGAINNILPLVINVVLIAVAAGMLVAIIVRRRKAMKRP